MVDVKMNAEEVRFLMRTLPPLYARLAWATS